MNKLIDFIKEKLAKNPFSKKETILYIIASIWFLLVLIIYLFLMYAN